MKEVVECWSCTGVSGFIVYKYRLWRIKGQPQLTANQETGDCNEDVKASHKRPDLKATSKMKHEEVVLYPKKRFGHLPGIDVGYQFYSQAEMVAIGFHSHRLNGIDYIGKSSGAQEYKGHRFPLAVAIVLSGLYEDDQDNSEDIIYTGQN